MPTYNKVFMIVAGMLLILTISVALVVYINFNHFGMKSAKEKAELTAEAVRDGLTSHMVNGTMDKRFYFLDNMARHQKIENLRVLRSDTVKQEYGDSLNDASIKDDIDKEVLKTGRTVTKMIDGDGRTALRVSIPYKATVYSKPNCLECHTNVKEGDVLGAISMEIDISNIKNEVTSLVAGAVAISFVFLLLALAVAYRMISPYVKLFEDLELGILKAHQGDFSYHISTKLKNKGGSVAKRLNELSNIYRFKKTIEMDKDKSEVIKRLVYVFENELGVESLVIFEIDHKKNRQTLLYSTLNEFPGKNINNPYKCRALRTGKITISTDFPELCEMCSRDDLATLCIPYRINDEYSMVIKMISQDREEIKKLQQRLPVIRNYLTIAHPVIESKILMDMLEETSYKDGLTELYNRRYLNNMLDENHFEGCDVVAILMVDIDFFKEVNDSYGHDVGDYVIKGLAKVLRETVSGNEIGVRFGGEEFILILPNVAEEEAIRRAEDIRERFSKIKFDVAPKSFSKTLSVGVAIHPQDGETIWKSIKFADVALYKAKEGGRNRVVKFDKAFYKEQEY